MKYSKSIFKIVFKTDLTLFGYHVIRVSILIIDKFKKSESVDYFM